MAKQNTDLHRGPITKAERDYVMANAKRCTVLEMAKALKRRPAQIQKLCSKYSLIPRSSDHDPMSVRRELVRELKSKSYWTEVEHQLVDGESHYFIDQWVNLMMQFKKDVLPTEELQIKQWIILDILINRCNKDRKRHIEDINRLEKLIKTEFEKGQAGDLGIITQLEQQLAEARNSVGAYDRTYTTMLDKINTISTQMKATRDQRIKAIEDKKKSWGNLMRYLDDVEIKQREGQEMEMMRLLAEKTKSDMQDYHTYGDGLLDSPLLTPETVVYRDAKEKVVKTD